MHVSLRFRALVEALGTFALIFAATGVIINGSFDLLGIALAPGIVVAIAIVSAGHISGVHLNPAVSLAFFLKKKLSWQEFLTYCIAQFAGAALASFSLRAIFTEKIAAQFHNGVNELSPATSYATGFAVEALLTMALIFVIFSVTLNAPNPRISWAPFAIGATVSINIMVMGNVTGAAFNPVRWFGPALAGGYWSNASLYLLAPLAGAAVAALLHNFSSSYRRTA